MRSLHRDPAYAGVMTDLQKKLSEPREPYAITDPQPLRTGNTLFPPLDEFAKFIIK